MSSSRIIRCSSPSILISVPAYFEKSTRSPALMSRARTFPSSRILPLPTATTWPSIGFSLAVSGMMMPPFVFSSSCTRLTITRSCRGRIFMGFLLAVGAGTRLRGVPKRAQCNRPGGPVKRVSYLPANRPAYKMVVGGVDDRPESPFGPVDPRLLSRIAEPGDREPARPGPAGNRAVPRQPARRVRATRGPAGARRRRFAAAPPAGAPAQGGAGGRGCCAGAGAPAARRHLAVRFGDVRRVALPQPGGRRLRDRDGQPRVRRARRGGGAPRARPDLVVGGVGGQVLATRPGAERGERADAGLDQCRPGAALREMDEHGQHTARDLARPQRRPGGAGGPQGAIRPVKALDALTQLQRLLMSVHGVEETAQARDYLVGTALRDRLAPQASSDEALLVSEGGDELHVALFLGEPVLAQLARGAEAPWTHARLR